MEPVITVDGLVIVDCRAKLLDFVRYDAYQRYDRDGTRAEPRPDVISPRQLALMNSAMRARSSRKAWAPFLERRLDELAAVPTDVDLVGDPEARVMDALRLLERAIGAVCVPWITDMAATKLFFLKRPRLVAISDSYVRSRLRVNAVPGPKRAIAVAKRVREVGLGNLAALGDLSAYASTMRDPAGEAVTLSKARILDILIWVEEAVQPGRNQFWGARYPVARLV
ncbi:MAG: DUF6308 family protein [Armatimonadota bacterium]